MTITNIPKKLIYLELAYNCIIKFLITDLHLPGMLNFLTDAILIALVWFIFEEDYPVIKIKWNTGIFIAGLLLFTGTMSALISISLSPPLYAWSFRNNFRLFVFFFCCYRILDKEDIKKILEMLLTFLYANIIVCVFEYFVRGMEYDFLGGLYGNGIEGGNGPLNALMIVAASYLIIEYINKSKPLWQLLFGIGGCLFIATVGELKIFYFEIVILVVLVAIFVTHNYRMAVFTASIFVIGLIGMSWYIKLYPSRADFLSFAFVREYSFKATYGASSEINRLTAIRSIWVNYFDRSIKKGLFGLGMGNGEMSSQYGFLTSPFYAMNGRRLRYEWFSQAFLFVEFGLVGLILYVSFFVTSGLKAFREKHAHYQMAMISMVFMVLMIFYNQALRIESFCYTAAFLAAIPYITERESERKERELKACQQN